MEDGITLTKKELAIQEIATGDSAQEVEAIRAQPKWMTILRLAEVTLLLYCFLVGISMLSGSFKMMGSSFTESLLNITSNPFIGLMGGMLATCLVQSSSVTTAIVVGLVASETLTVGAAVPMIMGANIGTSVTNTIVSLGFVKSRNTFKKAFAAATIHDFFNLLSVAVILPIEIMTGFLEKSATALSAMLYGASSGLKFKSPIKAAIKPAAKGMKSFVVDTLGFESVTGGLVLMGLSAIVIVLTLTMIVKVMKRVVETRSGEIIHEILTKNALVTILLGAGFTFMVQSSSITTSILVPMAGAGLINLMTVLPVTLGANIGTTGTAFLAALAGNMAGLSIALVHLLFNILGIMIWFPNKKMRSVPIWMAEKLSEKVSQQRIYALVYLAVVFFVIPLTGVFLFR
jgi:sodium-dependent phosphate cotransporter